MWHRLHKVQRKSRSDALEKTAAYDRNTRVPHSAAHDGGVRRKWKR
jgi:hypothetical protein